MARESRRGFLQKAAATGIALSAEHVLSPFASARGKAAATAAEFQIYLDTRRTLPHWTGTSSVRSWSIWAAPSTKGFMIRIRNLRTPMVFEPMC